MADANSEFSKCDSELFWINPDGSQTTSDLKAHNDAVAFLDYGLYCIPAAVVWGF